jgi:hypothetical protein
MTRRFQWKNVNIPGQGVYPRQRKNALSADADAQSIRPDSLEIFEQ